MIFKTIDSLEWRYADNRSAHIFEKATEDWSLCGGVTPNTDSHWFVIRRPPRSMRCFSCEYRLSSLIQ